MSTITLKQVSSDRTRVVLAGEFDASNAPHLRRLLDAAPSDRGGVLELDLERVTFLGAAALSALVGAHRTLGGRSARVVAVRPSSSVQRVLQLTQMEQVIDIADDFEAVDRGDRAALDDRVRDAGRPCGDWATARDRSGRGE